MKKLTYLLTAGVLLIILTTTGCKKDDGGGLSVEQEQLAALTGTWAATAVSDGTTRTDYADFTLTINSGMTYQTEGGPDLLPIPKGTDFEFGENVKSKLILEPKGVALSYTYNISADGDVLTLNADQTYSGPGFENARTNSVSGQWSFTFSKQ
ncbi:MAG: hypothetical protein WD555_00885 [Fulvivirga sp.]